MDAEVLKAFEEASKVTGIKFKVSGNIVVLDKPFSGTEPEEAKEQVETIEQGCVGGSDSGATTNPSEPATSTDQTDPSKPEDINMDSTSECYIGGTKHNGFKVETLTESFEGSDFTLGFIVKDAAGGRVSQAENWKSAKSGGFVPNLVHTLIHFTKLKNLLGWSGFTMTSGFRNHRANTLINGSDTSNHSQGYALDITFGKNALNINAYLQMLELYKAGKLCPNQFIFETGGGRSIIHLDFRPLGKGGRFQISNKIGGQKDAKLTQVTSKEQFLSLAKQYGVA